MTAAHLVTINRERTCLSMSLRGHSLGSEVPDEVHPEKASFKETTAGKIVVRTKVGLTEQSEFDELMRQPVERDSLASARIWTKRSPMRRQRDPLTILGKGVVVRDDQKSIEISEIDHLACGARGCKKARRRRKAWAASAGVGRHPRPSHSRRGSAESLLGVDTNRDRSGYCIQPC